MILRFWTYLANSADPVRLLLRNTAKFSGVQKFRNFTVLFNFLFQTKMSFEFSIPVSRDDLLNRTGVSQYVVDEVLSLREIAGALQGIVLSSVFRCRVMTFSTGQGLASMSWMRSCHSEKLLVHYKV